MWPFAKKPGAQATPESELRGDLLVTLLAVVIGSVAAALFTDETWAEHWPWWSMFTAAVVARDLIVYRMRARARDRGVQG